MVRTEASQNDFDKIEEMINNQISSTDDSIQNNDTIGNFVLLDQNTNRGYGNAIYPTKRMVIIGKEQGKSFEIGDDLSITEKLGIASFIPPCTRNVFMKYYTPNSTDIMSWTQADAYAYMNQIYETLKDFGVQDPKGNNGGQNQ